MKKIILLTLLFILPIGGSFAEEKAKAATVPDKLQESVIKFLNFTEAAGEKLVNAAETTGEWAKGEIPILIQEYLNWHFIDSLIWFSVGILSGVLFFVVGHYGVCKNWNEKWEPHGDPTDAGAIGVLSLIACFVLLLLAMILPASNLEWVQISVAPRVYLMDQFKYLLK